jgi:hypothetical protein
MSFVRHELTYGEHDAWILENKKIEESVHLPPNSIIMAGDKFV